MIADAIILADGNATVAAGCVAAWYLRSVSSSSRIAAASFSENSSARWPAYFTNALRTKTCPFAGVATALQQAPTMMPSS